MITAYASAVANPIPSRFDRVFYLADTPLPIAEVPLYGAGVDTEDGGAVWAYTWTAIREPPGAAGAWKDGLNNVQNPTWEDLQVWGNWRFFLVVTNTNTNETSETDPLKAPNSAFVHIRLKSERKGLEKPAPGERNHWAQLWDLFDTVEGLESAEDGDPVLFTAQVAGTLTYTGFRPWLVVTPGYDDPEFLEDPPEFSPALCLFHVPETMLLTRWSVALQDGGSTSPGEEYAFKLAFGTEANAEANTLVADDNTELSGEDPPTPRRPMLLSVTLEEPIELAANSVIGVLCTACPQPPNEPGGGMTVTIVCKRGVA